MEEPMSHDNSLTRREFTLEAALAILAGVTITISGCGSDSPASPSPSPAPSPSPGTSRTGTISANHGHTATISAAQLTAGNAMSLDIRGDATHPHTVVITQPELGQIAANQRVSKDSTNNDGHSHTVTFN
jgi:hypothetical protein